MEKRERVPTTEELAGRIIVLEALVIAALGMLARNLTVRSPEEMIGVLNSAKSAVRGRLVQEGIGLAGIEEAHRYEDVVLSQYSETVMPKNPKA